VAPGIRNLARSMCHLRVVVLVSTVACGVCHPFAGIVPPAPRGIRRIVPFAGMPVRVLSFRPRGTPLPTVSGLMTAAFWHPSVPSC
jgi:hypothetical protein